MAARKSEAPKRQAQAAEPAALQDPALATPEGAALPEEAAPAAAAPDPAPPEPTEEPAETDDAGRYPVLSPLRFDGRRYRPDDPNANEVVMPRDQAEALIAIDVLGPEVT